MSDKLRRFQVIEGGETAAQQRDALDTLECLVCKEDTGVATKQFITTQYAPILLKGAIEIEGTSGLICANCFKRGKLTQIMTES